MKRTLLFFTMFLLMGAIALMAQFEELSPQEKEKLHSELNLKNDKLKDIPPEVQSFMDEHGWRSGRIVGGEDADIADYPWQVALMQGSTQFCGGSIIHEEWILTAAHCLTGSWTAQYIRAGVTNRNHTTGQDINVVEYFTHPNFNNPVSWANDIALLRLESPLDLSGPNAKAIPIVTQADANAGLTNPGIFSAVTGWGALSAGGPSSNILQVVMVPIVSNAEAMNPGGYSPGSITDDMLCAGDMASGGIDACQGDSGGPLAVPDGAGGWKLAGITSWGNSCALPNYPGVYARVSYFEDWIGQYVEFADPMAPQASTNFVVVPGEMGALSADISWTNPDETVDGSALTQLNEVRLYRNGELIHTVNNPVIGGEESYTDTDFAEAGNYSYVVVGENAAGEGLSASAMVFVGEDLPGEPENVVLAAQGNDGFITWDAPESGLNNGWFDQASLTFSVVRFPDETELASGLTETAFTDTEVPGIGVYYYEITASNQAGVGGTGSSNPATLYVGDLVAVDIGTEATIPTFRIPFDFYWKNSLTQTIYYPEEMQGIGGGINAVLYQNSFATDLPGKEIRIYMSTTELEQMGDSYVSTADHQLVFEGTVDFPSGQNVIIIPLDNPFIYGGGNLLITTQRVFEDVYYASTDRFFVTETPQYPNRTRQGISDSFIYDPENPQAGGSNTLRSAVPNTTLLFDISDFGTVEGLVTDATSGIPLEGVLLTIENTHFTAYSNENGEYTFPYVSEGEKTIIASLFGYHDSSHSLMVEAGETHILDMALQPFVTVDVSGFVERSDLPGEGLHGATVQLSGYDNYLTETDEDGNFSISGVYANNAYQLTVSYLGYQTHQQQIEVEESNLDLGVVTLMEIAYPVSGVVAEITEDNDVHVSWGEPVAGESWNESFEAGVVPDGWTRIINNTGSGAVGAYTWHITGEVTFDDGGITPQDGDYQAFIMWSYDHQDEWLITPEFTCPPGELVFWYYGSNGSVNADNYYVKVSTDGGDSWTVLWNASDLPAGENYYAAPAVIDLSAYTGQDIHIAWNNVDGDGQGLWYAWAIDNISVGGDKIDIRDLFVGSIPQQGVNPAAKDGKFRKPLDIADMNYPQHRDARILESYNIYRFLTSQKDEPLAWDELVVAHDQSEFLDETWESLDAGVYQYAVVAVYTNDVLAPPAFSNTLPKDMHAEVTINITTNSGDSPQGAQVVLTNQNDDPQYVYSQIASESGIVVFEDVWKGNYDIHISLAGFDDYSSTDLEILENAVVFEFELNETLSEPYGLLVEQTDVLGEMLFSWNNILGESSFTDSFEDQTFDAWDDYIQGPGTPGDDGVNVFWHVALNTSAPDGTYIAHVDWGYNIDTWIISPMLVADENTQLSFWWNTSYHWSVSPNNNSDLHVKISQDDGQTWTSIWTEDDEGVFENFVWYQTVLDLSEYTGALRIAFNVVQHDGATVSIDHIEFGNGARTIGTFALSDAPDLHADAKSAGDFVYSMNRMGKAALGFDVYLDEALVGSTDTETTHFLFADLAGNTSFTAGVRAKYTTGNSEIVEISFTTPEYYLLSISADGEGHVEVDGEPFTAVIVADEVTEYMLEAMPNTGYHFSNWSGDLAGDENPVQILLDQDMHMTAHFAINVYSINASPNNPAFGAVVSGTGDYEHGDEVTLVAEPAVGYELFAWTENGSAVSTDTEYTFIAEDDRNLIAVFAIKVYAVEAEVNIPGAGTVEGTGNYQHGQTITLEATPETGYHFVNWTLDEVEFSADNPLVTEALEDISLMANFDLTDYTLEVHISPDNSGTVTKTPEQDFYNYQDEVSLEAIPEDGYRFLNWRKSGQVIGSDEELVFTMPADDATLSAYFVDVNADVFMLSLEVSPLGAGTVSGEGEFVEDEQAVVVAVANTGYEFEAWAIDGVEVSTDATFSYTMPADDVTLVAVFNALDYELDVVIVPENSGTVSLDPQKDYYNVGDVVELSALAATGYEFVNWTLDGTVLSAQAIYEHTMPADDVEITAHFRLADYNFSVVIDPENAGTVGNTSNTYNMGDEVSLTATAATGYEFVNWTLGATELSDESPFIFTMPAEDVEITANFKLTDYTLTALVDPVDAGTISLDPEKDYYNMGDEIELEATPASGYRFVNWMSNSQVLGADAVLDFTMPAADASITAHFMEVFVVTFSVEGNNGELGATVNGDAVTSGDELDAGMDVTFTAVPDAGYQVKAWTLDGVVIEDDEGENVTVLTWTLDNLQADVDVTVEFELAPVYYEVNFSVVGANGDLVVMVDGAAIADGDEVLEGSDINFIAAPEDYFRVKQWILNGEVIEDTEGNVVTLSSWVLEDLAADVEVTVEFMPYPHIVSIASVDDVSVDFGTSETDVIAQLDATTTITDSDGEEHDVELTWTLENYDPTEEGTYNALATFELPEGVIQSDPETALVVEAEVTVLPEVVAELYSVTLRVDMSTANGFDPDEDVVYISGIPAWDDPGSNPDLALEREGESMKFSIHFELEEGTYEYKYFINAGWDGGEWTGGENRSLIITDEDVVVNDVWAEPTTVDELELVNISVFPNPASGNVNVVSQTKIKSIVVFDISGKMMLSNMNVDEFEYRFYVSPMEPGLYIIQLQTEHGWISRKLQVNK